MRINLDPSLRVKYLKAEPLTRTSLLASLSLRQWAAVIAIYLVSMLPVQSEELEWL